MYRDLPVDPNKGEAVEHKNPMNPEIVLNKAKPKTVKLRCLLCDAWKPLSEFRFGQESCMDCNKPRQKPKGKNNKKKGPYPDEKETENSPRSTDRNCARRRSSRYPTTLAEAEAEAAQLLRGTRMQDPENTKEHDTSLPPVDRHAARNVVKFPPGLKRAGGAEEPSETALDRLAALNGRVRLPKFKPIQAPQIDWDMPVPKCGIKYLSPSSLSMFASAPDKFVKQYVCGGPRMAQGLPQALGSAFDCRVKSYMAAYVSKDEGLGKAEFERLFADAVEPPMRAWARNESASLFARYKSTGAIAALVERIADLHGELKYEFKAAGNVKFDDGFEVPILGKPDLYFVSNIEGLGRVHIIFDWKVNGSQSQSSPKSGYISLRDVRGYDAGVHKSAMTYKIGPFRVTPSIDKDWMQQLVMYSLMLAKDGSPQDDGKWIGGIDQLTFRPVVGTAVKDLRVATFMADLDVSMMSQARETLRWAWEHIQKQHYFPLISKEESDKRTRVIASKQSAFAVLGKYPEDGSKMGHRW